MKFWNGLAALSYIIVFILVYVYYLFPYHGYAHHDLKNPGAVFYLLGISISLIPIFFFRGIKSISSYLAVMIYLLVYIPTIVTMTFALDLNHNSLALIYGIYMPSMILLMIADRFYLNKKVLLLKQCISGRMVTWIALVSVCVILFAYRNQINFVSFDEVYQQRAMANEAVTSSFVGYLFMIASGSVFPFLLVYGLYKKQKINVLIGFVGCLLGYFALAAKGMLFLPFILFFLYWFLKKVNNVFVFISSGLSVVSLILLVAVINFSNNILIGWSSSILFQRTLGTPGLMNYLYYDFFSHNPVTYFSHINVINALTGLYPYGNQDLGFVVGTEYYTAEMNANANFWAMDGLAGFGIGGVLIISLIVFVFLVLLNSLFRNIDLRFLMVVFTPFMMNLCNVSFFTSLLSGGGLFVIILVVLLRKKLIGT